MSKTTALTLSAIVFCSLTPGAIFAAQPPDVVNSDSFDNTAMGTYALNALDGGQLNTAVGAYTLYQNTYGYDNVALGARALFTNLSGGNNVALGGDAMLLNTTGLLNTAIGYAALTSNTAGGYNTAVGSLALLRHTTGAFNIGIGYQAGYWLTGNSSNNIDIGYVNYSGSPYTESNTIRIGETGTHTATYIAGISGSVVTGAAVYVTSSGQLGVLASSERYKTDVNTMRDESGRLERLRPVTFKLNTDPKGAVQYGLIAEEVDKVFPELVIHNGDGRIEGVRYEELAPMLLNQIQLQQKQIAEQSKMLNELQQQLAQITELKRQVAELKKRDSLIENASLLQVSRSDRSPGRR